MDQSINELVRLLTQMVGEIKKNNISISELSNLFTQFIQEKKKDNLNNSEITTLLTQIVSEMNQPTIGSDVSTLFSQLIEEKKKAGISNSEITAFLTQIMGATKKNIHIASERYGNTFKQLTAPEIANLWTHYIRETQSVCINKYVLNSIEDSEIKSILEYALGLSHKHLETLTHIFNKENFPIPLGFTENDVNLEAPPLFSDIFWLIYLHDMDMHGLSGYSIAFSTSIRSDVSKHFYRCNIEAMEIYEKTLDLLLSKGVYHRPPCISIPENVDFVKSQNFITGWLGERRPLSCIEINNVSYNLEKSIMAKTLLLGFSQVGKSQKVRQFLARGVDIAQKHIEIFSSVLHEDNLPSPPMLDSYVTNSTTAPFSDKLMMYHTGFLFNVAVAYYGVALATSMRPDLATHCERAILEDIKAGEDWMNIMIKHGWLEQPPQAEDRKELARLK